MQKMGIEKNRIFKFYRFKVKADKKYNEKILYSTYNQ